MKYNTERERIPELLVALYGLLEAHRPAFRQEGPYWRAISLVMAELFAFARHTVTQLLMTMGLVDADWSAWYRLFSRERYDEEALAGCLLKETLAHAPEGDPYVIGVDATQVPRSSQKMPGTSWLKAPRTAPFKAGIHRAQRFVNGSWLTSIQEGFSRAIPLRFVTAFPEKAVPAREAPSKEWEAGLQIVRWVRQKLDENGREAQQILCLGDGSYESVSFWKGLPEGVFAILRTARNRRLRELPPKYVGRGRKRLYGERAPAPQDWLKVRKGWSKAQIVVRGREQRLWHRVEGPYLREKASDIPLFLIVVRGQEWIAGKQKRRRKRRQPAFYLISAIKEDNTWRLPIPIEEALAWSWQRWELEVAHREMKSGLGLGEKQCWSKRAAVTTVQWSAWLYAVLLLAGYRTWGLCGGPAAPARWWTGARRWSLTTLWREYRAALWGTHEFRALYAGTASNWLKNEDCLIALWNSVAGAARI